MIVPGTSPEYPDTRMRGWIRISAVSCKTSAGVASRPRVDHELLYWPVFVLYKFNYAPVMCVRGTNIIIMIVNEQLSSSTPHKFSYCTKHSVHYISAAFNETIIMKL